MKYILGRYKYHFSGIYECSLQALLMALSKIAKANLTLNRYGIHSNQLAMKQTSVLFVSLLILIANSFTANAQDSRFYDYFTSRESIEKDGVSLLVDVDLEIRRKKDPDGNYSNYLGSDNFIVTLTGLNTLVNGCEIKYNGKIYPCTGDLRPYFDAIQVTAISMTVTVDGLKDCPQFSYAAWKMQPGYNTVTRFCQQTSSVSITDISISSVSISGIDELKARIKELEKVDGNQEKIKSLLNEASVHKNKNEFDLAIAKYEEVLRIDPENYEATINRNNILSSRKQSENKSNNGQSDKKNSQDEARNSSAYNPYTHAGQLEAEADALLKSGNAQAASQKYADANKVMYSEERAKKLELVALHGIAAYSTEAFQLLVNAIGEAERRLDPDGKFDWKFIGLTYETAIPNSDGVVFSQPALNVQLSFLSFAFGVTFGYMQNQMQYFAVERINSWGQEERLPETVTLGSKGINLEVSIGFNIPVKNFSIRPMYGIALLSSDNYSIERNDHFELKEFIPEFETGKLNRASLGLYYQIPHTYMGVGIHFNYLFQRRYHFGFDRDDHIELNYIGSNPDYQSSTAFYVANPRTNEKESVKAFTTGISFIFGISKKR